MAKEGRRLACEYQLELSRLSFVAFCISVTQHILTRFSFI
jgi:hypothetical protein